MGLHRRWARRVRDVGISIGGARGMRILGGSLFRFANKSVQDRYVNLRLRRRGKWVETSKGVCVFSKQGTSGRHFFSPAPILFSETPRNE